MQRGMWGDLASITPPITVPAWACAMTGKTPGQLGIYGFRNRKDTSYEGLSIATADAVKEPAVWDVLGAKGLRSLLIGVPPSFPPPKSFPGLAGRMLPDPAVGEVLGLSRPSSRPRSSASSERATTTSSTSRTSVGPGTTSPSTRCSR